MAKPAKYGNKKSECDGYKFASLLELNRYLELKLLMRAGLISDLNLQVKFLLIPSNKKHDERLCSYYADFTYMDKSGQYVVEDTKGVKTADYVMKRKLMAHVHDIKIKEVTKK